MKEEDMQTNEAFMDLAIKKIEDQEKRIDELAGQLKKSSNSNDFERVKKEIEGLRADFKNIRFPAKEMQELSTGLVLTMGLLANPAERKVLHHHHVPKVTWIAAGLFFFLSLMAAGWYSTADKLSMYKANDTKYRYLKLDSTSRSLQNHLDQADSLYKSNPDLRQTVLETEELNRKHLEMLEKARQMEDDARELKRKVNQK